MQYSLKTICQYLGLQNRWDVDSSQSLSEIFFFIILFSGTFLFDLCQGIVFHEAYLTSHVFAASKNTTSEEYTHFNLLINYSIEDTNGTVETGKNNSKCHPEDLMSLNISTGAKCHLMVFYIDPLMVPLPLIHQDELSPILVDEGTHPFGPYKLSNVKDGTVILYAVASINKFTIDDIRPALNKTLTRIEKAQKYPKGIDPINSNIALAFPLSEQGEQFQSSCISFILESKP